MFPAKTFIIPPNKLEKDNTYNFTLEVTSLKTTLQSRNRAFQSITIVEEISNILQIKYKDELFCYLQLNSSPVFSDV